MEAALDNASAASAEPEADALEWAVVEIMGHRRHAGTIREVERFGAKLIRIDVYGNEGGPYVSHDYSGAAIFSISPTNEATARRLGEYDKPKPRPLLTSPEPRGEEFPIDGDEGEE